jgi:hypothetical protein
MKESSNVNRKHSLIRPRRRWEDNINTNLMRQVYEDSRLMEQPTICIQRQALVVVVSHLLLYYAIENKSITEKHTNYTYHTLFSEPWYLAGKLNLSLMVDMCS